MSSPSRNLAFCVWVLCLVGMASAYLPSFELQRICKQRTGLTPHRNDDYKPRNENCAIDCITKQGTVMTAYREDGAGCHETDGYRCVLGQCRSPDDKLEEENRLELNQVTINVKSAFVADLDPYPAQGESDAFVMIEVESNGEPSFSRGELICHTHVVQDSSRPRWNFSCRPPPMKANAKLKFLVYDSDKPDTDPQLLGTATASLETLMNAGQRSLSLENPDQSGPWSLEVEVLGKRYTPSE